MNLWARKINERPAAAMEFRDGQHCWASQAQRQPTKCVEIAQLQRICRVII